MNESVRDALEGVYRVFQAATPCHIDACPCCVSQSQVAVLLSKPLREITGDELTAYASAALLTTGDVPDFRYFLPRILEICLTERWWWPAIEVILGKLPLAEWEGWATSDVRALMDLFERAFDETIETSASNLRQPDVDAWICGFACSGIDVEPFLRKLEDPSAADALMKFFRANEGTLGTGGLTNAFWEDHRSAGERVVRWFSSPGARMALENARRPKE